MLHPVGGFWQVSPLVANAALPGEPADVARLG
jgi:hypothetical protein